MHTNRNDWRALGEERLGVAREARTPEDWKKRWKDTTHAFPFVWGSCWSATITYQVDDFAAEVGFFVDGLGFRCNAIGDDFCMLAAPDRSYFFCVTPVPDGGRATPVDTFRLSFMLDDIEATSASIDDRGIPFERRPSPEGGPDSPMRMGWLRTPNHVKVELWGLLDEPSGDA